MSTSTIPTELRRIIAIHFQQCCCYCQSQQVVSGMSFTIDHIIPEALGGATNLENLCFACWDCNLIKQKRIAGIDPDTGEMAAFYHPNQQRWSDHFAWQERGRILIGLTTIGRATVDGVRLNRFILMQARERWIKAGWHPPILD